MRRSAVPVFALALATLGFAPAPIFKEKYQDSKAVSKRVQGMWAMPRYEYNGRTMISKGEVWTVKIEKDQWTVLTSENGGPLTRSSTSTVKFNPKAMTPEIDLTSGTEYVYHGIYELKGDTMKLIFRANRDGSAGRARDLTRPSDFDHLMQLERQP